MGGYGSGGNRSQSKFHLEDFPVISVTALKKNGFFNADGPVATLSIWKHREKIILATRQTIYFHHIQFDYLVGDVLQQQRINFTTTPCHFGGFRHWFLCGNCSKRVGLLVFYRRAFMCRHCSGLGNLSSDESKYDRARRRTKKSWAKLNANQKIWFAPKPKYMHWQKYERLFRRAIDDKNKTENIFNVTAIAFINAFYARQ